jgi:hypothetical protein
VNDDSKAWVPKGRLAPRLPVVVIQTTSVPEDAFDSIARKQWEGRCRRDVPRINCAGIVGAERAIGTGRAGVDGDGTAVDAGFCRPMTFCGSAWTGAAAAAGLDANRKVACGPSSGGCITPFKAADPRDIVPRTCPKN